MISPWFSEEELEAIRVLVGKRKGKVVIPVQHFEPGEEWAKAREELRHVNVRAYYSSSLFSDTPILVFEHTERSVY
jgi:hypothetical protein